MNWSDEEKDRARKAAEAAFIGVRQWDEDVRADCREHGADVRLHYVADALLDFTASLFLSRGGTMTAERLAHLAEVLTAAAGKGGNLLAREVADAFSVQGARFAALEEDNERLARSGAVLMRKLADVALALGDGGCETPVALAERTMQYVSDLEKSLEQARKERDAHDADRDAAAREMEIMRSWVWGGAVLAQASLEDSVRVTRAAMQSMDEREDRIEKVARERDAAVADNAVLLDGFLRMMNVFEGLAREAERSGDDARAQAHHRSAENLRRVHAQPHPGSALLEELATLRGVRAQAQVDAKFIHEALGWAGEWPSSLPAPSRAVVALLEEHRKALADIKQELVDAHAERHEAESIACTLRQELADLGLAHNAAVDAFNASKRDHRKALVRARNEGLELLASRFDTLHDECTWNSPHAADCYLNAAETARAMKDPEQ